MAANMLNCRDCCHLVCDADHIRYTCINRFQSYVYVPQIASSVAPHLIHASLGALESMPQTTPRSV